MQDYYSILSLNSSATSDEIRRAYRILARRYHPDVNPGKSSSERFRIIAEAYAVLKDPEQRKQYDIEFQKQQRLQASRRLRGYAHQQRVRAADRYYRAQKADYERIKAWQAGRRSQAAQYQEVKMDLPVNWKERWDALQKSAVKLWNSVAKQQLFWKGSGAKTVEVSKISIVEVSITINDAIKGVRKTIEIEEPEGIRKINVRIPPGTRNGSTVRMRASKYPGEEIVLIVRVARHPFLSIEPNGLCLEIPVTVSEAILGASVKVPTLEEPVMLKIPPGSQSGTELRLRGKGIKNKEGTTGDLFVRLMVKVPESDKAVGIKEKSTELDAYYEEQVRLNLPKTLLEF